MPGRLATLGMRHFSHLPTRLLNAGRRVAAGLGLRGECVWPGVANDLFVAHTSIYHFFSRHTAGRRVLDAGCGTGYGSALLAELGAKSVRGVDVDARNIRFAGRQPHAPTVEYAVGDCQDLRLAPSSFDAIVSSNVLEHLPQPGRFLEDAREGLAPRGTLLIVVPPITTPALLRENEDVPFHVSNLSVDDWLALFAEHGFSVQCFRHEYAPGIERLDFRSPKASSARWEDFSFVPATRDELYRLPTLSAVYRLERRDGG